MIIDFEIELTTGGVSTSTTLPFFLLLAVAASFFLSSTFSSGSISGGGRGSGISTKIKKTNQSKLVRNHNLQTINTYFSEV